MRTLLIIIASVLLLFNAFGAIYGGWNFIASPDGSSMQMSTDWLKNSPFHSFLIPGIILFVVNGLFSLGVFVSVLVKYRHSPLLVMMQGAILSGWIVIQIIMLRTVVSLHLIMGATGLALLALGWTLTKTLKPEQKHR